MLDLDDLKKMNICEKCKCLYMPKYEEDRYGEHAINGEFCLRCDDALSQQNEVKKE